MEILNAIEQNNIDLVKELLSQGKIKSNAGIIDPKTKKENYTPLTYACTKGNIEAVKVLIDDFKADLNKQDIKQTPLFAAAFCGNLDIVKLLLEKGANIKTTCKHGLTALHGAVGEDQYEVAKYLISKKASVSLLANEGYGSPLFHATNTGKKLDCIKLLLKHKAEVNRPDKRTDGKTPFVNCFLKGKVEMMKVLLDNGADINSCYPSHLSLLNRGIDGGKETYESLEFLIKNNVDLNVKGWGNLTPLHRAMQLYHSNKYCNPRTKNQANTKVIELLVNHGAPLDQLEEEGKDRKAKRTALMIAAEFNMSEVLKIFLEKNPSSVKIQNERGDTALHYLFYNYSTNKKIGAYVAPKKVSTKSLKMLLTNKADPNLKNNVGISPFYYMIRRIYGDKSDIDLLRYFLKYGADANMADSNGDTPFLLMAEIGEKENLELLVKHGVDINATNKDDQSALHFAVTSKLYCGSTKNEYKTKSPVSYLLELGSTIQKNCFGEYPYYFAQNVHQVESFIEKGCDFNVQSNNGNTPLIAYTTRQGNYLTSTLGMTILEKVNNLDLTIKNENGQSILDIAEKNDWKYFFTKVDEMKKKLQKDSNTNSEQLTKPKDSSTPKESSSKPKESSSTPKESSSKQKESSSKSKESSSKPKESASTPKESSSKQKESSSKSKESSSKPKESSSKPKESASTSKESPSKPKESASTSKPKESSSKPKGSASTPKESSSTPKESSSKPKGSASTPKESSSTPKESSSILKESPSKTEESEQKVSKIDKRLKAPVYKQDVMISYQWDHQELALKIRDYLKNEGNLTVWIDVDCMYGNINKCMTKGVYESKSFIMCMSEKYEESQNCEIEYDYAFTKRKKIIPVKMEKDFHPEPGCLLEMILGSKLYYVLDGNFDKTMPSLLNEIKEQIKDL